MRTRRIFSRSRWRARNLPDSRRRESVAKVPIPSSIFIVTVVFNYGWLKCRRNIDEIFQYQSSVKFHRNLNSILNVEFFLMETYRNNRRFSSKCVVDPNNTYICIVWSIEIYNLIWNDLNWICNFEIIETVGKECLHVSRLKNAMKAYYWKH